MTQPRLQPPLYQALSNLNASQRSSLWQPNIPSFRRRMFQTTPWILIVVCALAVGFISGLYSAPGRGAAGSQTEAVAAVASRERRRRTTSQNFEHEQVQEPPDLDVFVGVQSAPWPDYKRRRDAIRSTWLQDRKQLEADYPGVRVRFMIGHEILALKYYPEFVTSRVQPACKGAHCPPEAQVVEVDVRDSSDTLAPALSGEMEEHGDMVFLPVADNMRNLPKKVILFFAYAQHAYSAAYVVKVDDDVYVRVPALLSATHQWASASVGYAGCMVRGAVARDPGKRLFEPAHYLLADTYFTHASGAMYALSRNSVALITAVPPPFWRYFSSEDISMGAWMLALAVSHHHDMRVCSRKCAAGALAVWSDLRPTADNVIAQLSRVHDSCGEQAKNEGAT